MNKNINQMFRLQRTIKSVDPHTKNNEKNSFTKRNYSNIVTYWRYEVPTAPHALLATVCYGGWKERRGYWVNIFNAIQNIGRATQVKVWATGPKRVRPWQPAPTSTGVPPAWVRRLCTCASNQLKKLRSHVKYVKYEKQKGKYIWKTFQYIHKK